VVCILDSVKNSVKGFVEGGFDVRKLRNKATALFLTRSIK